MELSGVWQMKMRLFLILLVAAFLILAVAVLVFPYRYVVLSKVNVNPASDGAPALSWRQVAEIPLPGGVSRFDYQSIDATRGLLFIAHLGASRVLALDLKAQKIVADIPDVASAHGVIVVPELHRLYATATGKNQVAVIDEDTFRVVAQADGGDYPDGLAYDPEDEKVFVSDEIGGTDTVIDATTNTRVATIDLGGEVGNTQYDPGSRTVLAAVQGRNQLAIIDPKVNAVAERVELPNCREPHGLYLDTNARLAFVACAGNSKLVVLNLQTLQVMETQTIGQSPDVLAFDYGSQCLYVAAESGIVSVFQERGRLLEKLGEAYLAPNAHTIAVDSATHRVYVPLENVDGHPVLRVFEPVSGG
jgi:DNA-binding beta-propeller fold protein YncE